MNKKNREPTRYSRRFITTVGLLSAAGAFVAVYKPHDEIDGKGAQPTPATSGALRTDQIAINQAPQKPISTIENQPVLRPEEKRMLKGMAEQRSTKNPELFENWRKNLPLDSTVIVTVHTQLQKGRVHPSASGGLLSHELPTIKSKITHPTFPENSQIGRNVSITIINTDGSHSEWKMIREQLVEMKDYEQTYVKGHFVASTMTTSTEFGAKTEPYIAENNMIGTKMSWMWNQDNTLTETQNPRLPTFFNREPTIIVQRDPTLERIVFDRQAQNAQSR